MNRQDLELFLLTHADKDHTLRLALELMSTEALEELFKSLKGGK